MDELHLFIHGTIGEDGLTAANISKKLATAKEASTVVLHIDSRGGYVDEGFRMYDLLANSGKKINAYITGDCMSIALYLLTVAAKGERVALASSKFMAHQSWTSADFINADSAKELAVELSATDKEIKSKLSKIMDIRDEAVLALYNEEAVFDAAKALELGVITSIAGKKTTKALEVNADRIMAASNYLSNRPKKDMDDKKNEQALSLLARIAAKFRLKADSDGTIKNMPMTLADGTVVYADNTEVGTGVFSDEAMTMPVADGTYTLEDGTSITVAGGVISEVENSAVAALKAENASLKAELETQKAELETQKKAAADATAQVTAVKADVLALQKIVQGDQQQKSQAKQKPVADPKTGKLPYADYKASLRK